MGHAILLSRTYQGGIYEKNNLYFAVVYISFLSIPVISFAEETEISMDADDQKTTQIQNNPDFRLNSNCSLYCWNLYLLNEGSFPSALSFLKEEQITRVYQEIPSLYLKQPETAAMISNLNANGIETVALLGDRSWGLADNDLTEPKAAIDALKAYNDNANENNAIHKIAFDIETYTYSDWKNDPEEYFISYIRQMQEIYHYSHAQGFDVVMVIPVHYDSIDVELLRQFIETCCDEVSLMNYSKPNQVRGIENEVAICRELGMSMETIFETMPLNETYSVTEEITYFYEGYEAMQQKRSLILDTYRYENLSTSYHHFPTFYHVATGKYLAELYAYTNSADPSRNDLGQTESLKSITLHGSDGSVIQAGLYNPNIGAAYEETCYLAIGVMPDVTYTITADSDNYTVLTNSKTFTFPEDELIDYTSIRLEYVEEIDHTLTYQKVTRFSDEEVYAIVNKQKALGHGLSATSVTISSADNAYTLTSDAEDKLLWHYKNGKLWYESESACHYLMVNSNGTLMTTTDSEKASLFTISSGRISTTIKVQQGKRTQNKTYYITISGEQFIASTKKASMTLYELMP